MKHKKKKRKKKIHEHKKAVENQQAHLFRTYI